VEIKNNTIAFDPAHFYHRQLKGMANASLEKMQFQ